MSEVIPFRKGLKPQELVLRFMDSVGHKRDAETYLKNFTAQKPESFAILVIDEEVLTEDLDAIIFDLRYLLKLSLFPVILLHASDETLAKLEIESYFQRAKLAAYFIPEDLNPLEKLEFIQSRIKKNSMALLSIRPEENLFTEIAKLVHTLKTKKVIFLKRLGGLIHQKTQAVINLVNLRFEKDTLLESGNLSAEDERFLTLSDELIRQMTHKVYVSCVSPFNLLRELFTVKGAGTLIQLGSEIRTYRSWDQVNKPGLKVLLQTSFEKKIRDDFFQTAIDSFYIEEHYQGAALVRQIGDMAYLSKFAVGTEARGLGIGRDLWEQITAHHPRLFWRSDPEKFITSWYVKQCDGLHKAGRWTVFWKGIEPTRISEAVQYAMMQPEDFE